MVPSFYLRNALLIRERRDWGNSKSQNQISLINKIRCESKVNKRSLGAAAVLRALGKGVTAISRTRRVFLAQS